MGNQQSKSSTLEPDLSRSSDNRGSKLQRSKPEVAVDCNNNTDNFDDNSLSSNWVFLEDIQLRNKKALSRLPHETRTQDLTHQNNIEGLDYFSESSLRDIANIYLEDISTNLIKIRWDTIPSKEWSLLECRLWIRAYLIEKVWHTRMRATEAANKFERDGEWLLCMGVEEWIRLCPSGGRSIWGFLEEGRRKGVIPR